MSRLPAPSLKDSKSGKLKASALSKKNKRRIAKMLQQYKAIPEDLPLYPHWVVYKKVEKEKPDGTRHITKVPYAPNTSKLASTSDPTTWASFEKAVAALEKGAYDGIGYVFSEEDPYAGIDLDHCIEDGEIAAWAKTIIKKFNSYSEKSPSGHGVHILVEGTVPDGGNKKGNIEMYSSGRYFTVTGNKLEDAPSEIKRKPKTLKALHAEVFSASAVSTDISTASVETGIDEEELMLKLESSNGGNNKFMDLFAGDTTGYASQSEADLALCSIIAFRTEDPGAIDSLFRQSKLYRPKWDAKHGDKTYGQKTIQKALANIPRVDVVDVVEIDPDKKLIPITPFPFDVFPQEMVEAINVMSEALYIQPEVVASIMLAIISSAIGNTVVVSPKVGAKGIPPFLWLIIIAPSGYGKTPVINTLMEPINQLQALANITYQEELKKYKKELEEARGDEKKETPQEPKLKHYTVSDATVEALANVFESFPRGVVSHQDEISGLLLGFNQYRAKGGNDRQHYLELFNAGSWKIDRKGGPPRFIPNTGAAIVGGIQTKIMPSVFGEDSFDDGFLPRFLLLPVGRLPFKFNDTGVGKNIISYWSDILKHMYEIPLEYDELGFVKPQVLKLTKKAKKLWANFYNEYGSILLSLSERGQAFIPKLLPYYGPKFAGILHCIRAYQNKKSVEGPIDSDTIEGAIKLTRYFAGQDIKAKSIFDQPTNKARKLQRLIEAIHELGNEVKNGKLAVSKITNSYNAGLPQGVKLLPRRIGSLLRGLGLETEAGTGGFHFLLWDEERLRELFSKTTSTTSTTSTEEKTDVERVK